ncbi:MAG: glycosyltransferase family 39 protein [Candidatus Goldiibacteriota bacterium]
MNNYFKTALAVFSCALILTGQYFLYVKKLPLPGILMVFAGALAVFIVSRGALLSLGAARAKKPGKKEIAALVFIVAAAFFFRFYQLDELPAGAHRDEAKACMDAVGIMNSEKPMYADSKLPVYIRGLTDNPAVFNYIIASYYKMTSPGIVNARTAAAFLGVLAVIAFYFLLRALFGVNTALAASFLFASMKWHVVFSRTVYHAGFSVLLLILAVYYAHRAYVNRKTADFIVFAAVFSMSLYTFQAARAIPFAFAACLVFAGIKEPGFIKKNIFKIGIFALLVFLLSAPLLDYMEKNRKTFFARAAGHSVFSAENMEREAGRGNNAFDIYLNNAKKNLLMFNVRGDIHFPYNVNSRPMLDIVTGAAALAGFFTVLFMMFYLNSFAWFMMIMFGVFMHGGILFIGAPHSTRTILTMPFAVVFAGVFIYALFIICGGCKKKVKYALAGAGIMLLGAAGAENYNIYFNEYKNAAYHWHAFSADSRMAGAYVLEHGSGKKGLIEDKYLSGYESYAFWLEISGRERDVERFSQEAHIPYDDMPEGGFYYILSGSYEPFLDVLEKIYPGGRAVRVYDHNRPGVLSHFYFEVPRGRAAAAKDHIYKGLKTEVYSRYRESAVDEYYDMTPVFAWKKLPHYGPIMIKWTGKLNAPASGGYTFEAFTKNSLEFYIDGHELMDISNGRGKNYIRLILDEGLHDFKAVYRTTGNRMPVKILWETPEKNSRTIIPPENFVKENEVDK